MSHTRIPRPSYHCLRCGKDWIGFNIDYPPVRCARCRSFYWNREPIRAHARRPSDPPNPKWKEPKGHAPKMTTLPRLPKLPRPLADPPNLRRPMADTAPRGLPPPPRADDVPLVAREPYTFAPPPRAEEPTPESFIHAAAPTITPEEQVLDAIREVLDDADRPPELASDLAAEADIREQEYLEGTLPEEVT